MFVLSRTVWVRNSLFITVEGEMFSLVKISGKLYKSCMCLILSQSCSFIQLCTDIGFRVQFNAEFTSQVMNFPIEYRVKNTNILILKVAK